MRQIVIPLLLVCYKCSLSLGFVQIFWRVISFFNNFTTIISLLHRHVCQSPQKWVPEEEGPDLLMSNTDMSYIEACFCNFFSYISTHFHNAGGSYMWNIFLKRKKNKEGSVFSWVQHLVIFSFWCCRSCLKELSFVAVLTPSCYNTMYRLSLSLITAWLLVYILSLKFCE